MSVSDASFKEIAELISRSLGLGGRTKSLNVDYVIALYREAARYAVASNSRVSAGNAQTGLVSQRPFSRGSGDGINELRRARDNHCRLRTKYLRETGGQEAARLDEEINQN